MAARDVGVGFGAKQVLSGIDLGLRPAHHHGPHRAHRLWQVHVPAVAEPDERQRPGLLAHGDHRARRASRSRVATWTPSCCGAGWAWSSSGPTPSPCRSVTTSSPACGRTAWRRAASTPTSPSATCERSACGRRSPTVIGDSPSVCRAASSSCCAWPRALAVEPDVLLLDEPTSSLDPVTTEMVEELLRRLGEKLTIVIVTHNLAQARRVARDDGVPLQRHPGRVR